MSSLKPVGLKEFTKEVIKSEGTVLVDFWAGYCQPCKIVKGELEQVARGGVKVVTVDIEEEPELTDHYKIESLPTVIAFRNGKPVKRVTGTRRASDFEKLAR